MAHVVVSFSQAQFRLAHQLCRLFMNQPEVTYHVVKSKSQMPAQAHISWGGSCMGHEHQWGGALEAIFEEQLLQ